MPPDRDVEFVIGLLPGMGPIAKRPYHMSVDELEELKKQLAKMGFPCLVCEEEWFNEDVH
jgi:hypothetical protein